MASLFYQLLREEEEQQQQQQKHQNVCPMGSSPKEETAIQTTSPVHTSTCIVLSSAGLRRISQDRMPKDFTFIVNGTHYMWNSVLAEYLSPRVAENRDADPTCCELVIDIDETDEERLQSTFKSLLNLSVGVATPVTSENKSLILNLAWELGNMEILEQMMDEIIANMLRSDEGSDSVWRSASNCPGQNRLAIH